MNTSDFSKVFKLAFKKFCMAFNDKIRWGVKEKAHFKCCWCQLVKGSLDAHHIIPEAENGPDTFDNAAPLCKDCHDTFGSNPSKRSEIRRRRDWWYKICEDSLKSENVKRLEEMENDIRDIKSGNLKVPEYEKKFKKIENVIKEYTKKNIEIISSLDSLSPEQKKNALAQISSASSTIISGAAVLTDIPTCPNCNQQILTVTKRCLNCGNPL